MSYTLKNGSVNTVAIKRKVKNVLLKSAIDNVKKHPYIKKWSKENFEYHSAIIARIGEESWGKAVYKHLKE